MAHSASSGCTRASDLPAGTVGVKPGANNAGVDHFIIRIHGKSAHVSTPQLGVDALYIASELVVALQSIVTRMTSPVEPVLIGVGKLNAGAAYNAVAETAVLEGTTRMFSPESRAHLRETINAAAAHISALYGGTAEVEWDNFATPLTNDAGVCGEVERVADALGIPHDGKPRAVAQRGRFRRVSAANEGRLRLPRHGKPQKAAHLHLQPPRRFRHRRGNAPPRRGALRGIRAVRP